MTGPGATHSTAVMFETLDQDTQLASAAAPVLCVDLDGTLIRTDLLVEGLVEIGLRGHLPRAAWVLLTQGRAALKRLVAGLAPPAAALLPYNEPFLDYLHAQKRAGRRLVLATAADEAAAQAVAAHLGLFDEVIASDGGRNLGGAAKGNALAARFGKGGFVYAGNAASDLQVWKQAGGAVIVNASRRTAVRAAAMLPLEARFDGARIGVRAALRAMRPHQWVKNLLVFLPIFTAHAVGERAAWAGAVIALAAFSATASGIYLFNDLSDLSADRIHPRKRRRPFASGALPIPLGIVAGLALLAAGLALAAASGALLAVGCYAVMSISYSLRLKKLPLVDIFTLAGLYTIRLIGGGIAVGHALSPWLLAFSGFVFLSLAIVKRVAELLPLVSEPQYRLARRGYFAADLPLLQMFGCASAFSAALVLTLFVQSEAALTAYRSPILLWSVVPLVLFWLCRIWLSTVRGHMHDDPIIFAARDWVSWAVTALCLAVMLAATIGLPLLR